MKPYNPRKFVPDMCKIAYNLTQAFVLFSHTVNSNLKPVHHFRFAFLLLLFSFPILQLFWVQPYFLSFSSKYSCYFFCQIIIKVPYLFYSHVVHIILFGQLFGTNFSWNIRGQFWVPSYHCGIFCPSLYYFSCRCF